GTGCRDRRVRRSVSSVVPSLGNPARKGTSHGTDPRCGRPHFDWSICGYENCHSRDGAQCLWRSVAGAYIPRREPIEFVVAQQPVRFHAGFQLRVVSWRWEGEERCPDFVGVGGGTIPEAL